ncbi:ATP-binding protein [Geodermatophilus sp. SYSU D00691]
MADERIAVDSVRPGDGLPAGTVTFLFTDIVGSTRLLREDRHGYAAALAEHRRLLRAAFTEHGGHEVDTQGDSFFVAFPSAGQALAAAVDAQRALAAQPGPDERRISVRMGLHTGEATVADGSYVGLAVHCAARIAAAASGGQVLLSDITAAVAAGQLPGGAALHFLGEHELKDFPGRAPLYQLDIAGLPNRFPPPRTTSPRRLILPDVPDHLLGRDGDVDAVAALLTNARIRLVTVTGPGGIGKTRLALTTARTVADEFPGGVVFAPLSAITDPRLVLGTVADVICARCESGSSPVDAIATAVEERTLFVLDNFEQVVEAAGDLSVLLDSTPAAVALVTSRQALRLRAEQQFPLAPLAAGPAERLFAERAAAVRPGFTLDAANAAAVAEICRRLDGLPLAIELAAARTRLLPPPALLARLGQRLDVLGAGPVDLPARQRTLRATMDWSFGLLGPHEQAVFTRLAVFSGGWTLDAAESVCGRPGEPAVLDALAALLDASLLAESGESIAEPRLYMLDTVAAYATEKLAASPDRDEAGRRHTEWMVELTGALLTAPVPEVRGRSLRLDDELPNLRTAIDRVLGAGDLTTAALLVRNTFGYMTRRDGEREVGEWLDRSLAMSHGAPDAVRGRLLVLRALVAGILNDLTAVAPLLDEGRPLLPDDADHEYDRSFAATAGIYAAVARGSLEGVRAAHEEALARFIALGQELGEAYMEMVGGDIALASGDLDTADRRYRRVVELARRLDDDAMIGQAMSLRGLVLLSRGDVAGARRSVLDGAAANQRWGQTTAIAYSLEGLAAVALADGHPAVAARALAAAAAARRHIAAPLTPALPPLVADLAARSRSQLGDQAYDAACHEGGQWSPQHALERTLDEIVGRPAALDE